MTFRLFSLSPVLFGEGRERGKVRTDSDCASFLRSVYGWTAMTRVISDMFGVIIILLVLADVYLTVLYARVGAGLLSHRLACWMWYAFRVASKPFTRARETILSFCGPTI